MIHRRKGRPGAVSSSDVSETEPTVLLKITGDTTVCEKRRYGNDILEGVFACQTFKTDGFGHQHALFQNSQGVFTPGDQKKKFIKKNV